MPKVEQEQDLKFQDPLAFSSPFPSQLSRVTDLRFMGLEGLEMNPSSARVEGSGSLSWMGSGQWGVWFLRELGFSM